MSDAFEIFDAPDLSPVIVLCDHASRRIPADICTDDLGLGLSDLDRHIAYDVGAEPATLRIARGLGATAICARFSRLLIDANRGEDDPTLLMRLYDGTVIPGNRNAGEAEKARRLERFHRPYHRAIGALIDARLAAGITPVLVSIHSFTPQLRGGRPRPWQIAVLWHADDRLSAPLIRRLGALPGLCVGDNEPYSGGLPGDTLHRHGLARGLPHVLVEFRNDLIAGERGQRDWADLLLPALRGAIGDLGI
jgi:predicted N-formylglutamate amidohydrolase